MSTTEGFGCRPASHHALTGMTRVTVELPLVVAHRGWTAYVFRARVSSSPAALSASDV